MTVITVAATDDTPVPVRWESPNDYSGARSPIPSGLLIFAGDDAIAILGAGDETAYSLTITMPNGHAYLPRNLQHRFGSADLVNNFGDNGSVIYGLANPPMLSGLDARFNYISPGEYIVSAVVAERIWVPGLGAQKLLLRGGDTMVFVLSDMASGGSTAGTMRYWLEFYQFNVDQVDKWEVNTPTPVISHTSF